MVRFGADVKGDRCPTVVSTSYRRLIVLIMSSPRRLSCVVVIISTDQIDLLRDYSRLLQTRSQTELILSLTAAFAKCSCDVL